MCAGRSVHLGRISLSVITERDVAYPSHDGTVLASTDMGPISEWNEKSVYAFAPVGLQLLHFRIS
jgi:hypothetical protein